MTSHLKLKTVLRRTVNPVVVAAVLAGSVLAASGCSQSPFEDKSEAVKKAIPIDPNAKPPTTRGTSKDAVLVDSTDYFTFREGVESVHKISGRVVDSASSFTLTIENMDDFPGATFDQASGEFRWAPPRNVARDSITQKKLSVRIFSPSPEGGVGIGTTKDIAIHVTRTDVDPEIVEIQGLKDVKVREGEALKFNVVVKDPDSEDRDGARPVLTAITAKRGVMDVAGLVYVEPNELTQPNPSPDPLDPRRWIFRMVLDLQSQTGDKRGRDFTSDKGEFSFGLKVVSRFGRTAMKEDPVVTVWTDVLNPEISWGAEAIDVVVGQENRVQFTVFDPYNEGQIVVNFLTPLDRLPGGSAIGRCSDAAREGPQLCTITWKPTAGGDVVGSSCDVRSANCIAVEIEAINKSRIPGDDFHRKVKFTRRLHLIKVTP